YVGGREHAVLHLLYARFWHKVLYDRGYVSTPEPFKKLFHQGLILAFSYMDAQTKVLIPSDEVEEVSEGKFVHTKTGRPAEQTVAKMSKTLKNVVNPDDIIHEHGADAFRIYEMFMGPLADSKPWDSRAVGGMVRQLQRSYRLYAGDEGELRDNLKDRQAKPDPEVEKGLHRCLQKVTEDLDKMAFNTALAAIMEFVNLATPKVEVLTHAQLDAYARILSVFAPHLGEELWEMLGNPPSVMQADWPKADPALLVEDTVEIPVALNGKPKTKVFLPADADEEAYKQAGLEAIAEHINGKTVRKVIVVLKRMINVVAN
ncbi:MAG: class I tRNA ligase family protein, partial [Candidatus Eremiobacteraeota bacterium]|nr:class I tRNA ligase family protein [Candidatus Eremiobacteraeota bacterium]